MDFHIDKDKDKNNDIEEKNQENSKTKKYEILKNIFISHYIKLFPNVFIVLEIISKLKKSNHKVDPINNLLDLKNNLIYKSHLILDGKNLSNVMFNIFQNYTYTQRLDVLKKFKIDLDYSVNYYIYETCSQIDLFDMIGLNSNIFVLFDKSSKIRFGSIFFNPNTIEVFKNSHKFCKYIQYENNTMIVSQKSLFELIYFQTLKKWIYNIYSGNEIEKIIIGEPDLSKSNLSKLNKSYSNTDYLILIDNVTTNMSRIKKINSNKIFFVNIIFLKSSQYKTILVNKKKVIDSISNPQNHWELEGIKFMMEKIEI